MRSVASLPRVLGARQRHWSHDLASQRVELDRGGAAEALVTVTMQATVGVKAARSLSRPTLAMQSAAAQRTAHSPAIQRSRCRATSGSAAARARQRAALLRTAAAEGSNAGVGGPLGIIIECDGALLDAHGEGHRVAFNRAFAVRGHLCVGQPQQLLPLAAFVAAVCPTAVKRSPSFTACDVCGALFSKACCAGLEG